MWRATSARVGAVDLWELDAAALHEAYAAGACTPLDVVDACLARIEAVDPQVGAFVEVLADEARAAARRLPAVPPTDGRLPLYGVPFAVKDLFDVAGCRTTAGSEVPFGDGRPAAGDAVAVARLRAAGGILLGRTRTHEFAWGITTRHPRLGGTVNPRDPSRVAGGSSGGSAAAVASGAVPVALGTDTGGSIRIPAAFCGVVGWKPTRGVVSLDGVVPLSPTLDHGGVLARTVADVALVATPSARRPVPVARRVGMGAPTGIEGALADAGVEVVELALPAPDELRAVQVAIQQAEVLDLHQRQWGTWPRHADRYGEDVAERFRLAAEQVTPARTEAAYRRRAELIAEVDAVLERAGVDAVLLPLAPCGPSTLDDPDHVVVDGVRVPLRDAVMPWTALGNVTGFPACAVPVGLGDHGLPRAVQLLGRPDADESVLDAAALVEAHYPPLSVCGPSTPPRTATGGPTRS
jgi:aspartyl-tRNA(Asn)/glutamyl-tRNA(Gln) amidotransferase subunit A